MPVVTSIYGDDATDSELRDKFLQQASASLVKAATTNLTLLSTSSALTSIYEEFALKSPAAAQARRRLMASTETIDLMKLVFAFEVNASTSDVEMAYLEMVETNKMKIALGWNPKTASDLMPSVVKLENALSSGRISETLLEYSISVIPQFSSEDEFLFNESYLKDNKVEVDNGIASLDSSQQNILVGLVGPIKKVELQNVIDTVGSSDGNTTSSSSGSSSSDSIDKEEWFYIILAIAGGVFCIVICGICVCSTVQRSQIALVKQMKQMQTSVKMNNYVGTNGQVQSPVKPIKITPYKTETLKSDSKDIESNGPMIRQEDPQMTTEKSEDLKDDSPYISESEIIDDRDIDEADLEIIDGPNGDERFYQNYMETKGKFGSNYDQQRL